MTLMPSEDERIVRDTARAFLNRTVPLTEVRRLADEGIGFDRAWWRRVAELGWTGFLVPEQAGGSSVDGDGVPYLIGVAHEMGRLVSPGPLTGCAVAAVALAAKPHRSAVDHARLRGLADGTLTAAWATYRTGTQAWDPMTTSMVAETRPDHLLVSGEVDRVEYADEVDLLLVPATVSGQLVQLLVPTDAPGISITPTPGLDLVRRYARVQLDGVRLRLTDVVTAADDAATVIVRQAEVAMVLQLAETVGCLEWGFETTLAWTFNRFSFGRPLASYQVIKHRIADLRVTVECCGAAAALAAQAVSELSDDRGEIVSIAKAYIGEHAVSALQECVQLHGAIGITWEHDLHLFLRRATVNRAHLGTPEQHRRQVADLLTGRGA
jgi:alkylation response protein AidB-like acyl-CoA dehydrogenase